MDSTVPDSSNPLDEFPPEVRQDVQGLLYLGHLTAEIDFCGHYFSLRTLKAGEEMAAAKVVEPYVNTVKAAEAWSTAQVALALTQVDGDEDFCPAAGPDPMAHARARFQYMGRWFQPTIDYLFGAYADLLDRQVEAVRALQDLSARSLPTSSPSADFLSELGTFEEPTASGAPISPS
jgi:hypothetical protein